MEAGQFAELNKCSTEQIHLTAPTNSDYCTVLLVLSLIFADLLNAIMPYRTYVPICASSAKMVTIRSHVMLLQFSANIIIASHELTSRTPCSGLRTVPSMDCAVQSRELTLERFASTTAMAMVHLDLGCLVWVVCPASTTAILTRCFT